MKKGYKYFFSPQPTAEDKNEYIDNFFDTLAKKATVINYGKKPASRSADVFKYMFSADVMILNWPEDILHLRFGIPQLFISFITLPFFRLKGGKIIWICHNKESHNKQLRFLRKIARSFFSKISSTIIVLSNDALTYFLNEKKKTYFLNHPVYSDPPLLIENNINPNIDVLIWGRISPYKGLNEFIDSYRKHNGEFSVKIIGRADKAYLETIRKKSAGLNIEITDKYTSNEELAHYFKSAKIILLPYADSDTFSSGALIHSLSSNKIIIGPAIGNFNDLTDIGACMIYKNFTDLFSLINHLLQNPLLYEKELAKLQTGIKKYYEANSWSQFIDEIISISLKK